MFGSCLLLCFGSRLMNWGGLQNVDHEIIEFHLVNFRLTGLIRLLRFHLLDH